MVKQREQREREQQRREGVSRLTGSPRVLGLPPPSVYRCPAETEGTTELHTPPSPALPTLPNVPYYCTSGPYGDNLYYTHGCFWSLPCHPSKKNCPSKIQKCMHSFKQAGRHIIIQCQKKQNYKLNSYKIHHMTNLIFAIPVLPPFQRLQINQLKD